MFLGLVILVLLLSPGLRPFSVIGLSAFCGGALSNLIDRVTVGGVVDFLNLGLIGFHPYIFNIADVAIALGAALALLCFLAHLVKAAVHRG